VTITPRRVERSRGARGLAAAAALTLAVAPLHRAVGQAADTGRLIRTPTMTEDLQMFSQVLNQIRVNHADSLNMHELMMAAIEGMVHAADPHSFVIPVLRLNPAKEAEMEAGRLIPVPVEFSYVDDAPIVTSVDAGSHAAHQDILMGDELVSVDGKPVTAESALELQIALAGQKGSTVTLGLERRRPDGSLARLSRSVVRERVEAASAVPAAFMLDSVTGYVRITTFMGDRVADDLHAALGKLEDAGMQRLVLDLRDNGGGRVDQAARIAGEFLPKGDIVYTAEGRKADVTDTSRVSRSFWRSEKRYPIVLIVNDGTASASEIVAGALQDHDRALIMGRPTFGKSLLMQGFPMTDGSVIELVIGHVRTPCGRIIQREYRGISRREYYRLASAERDTVGRPSCKTDAGRVVYGGGGIYPDALVGTPPAVPAWLARVQEMDLVLRWMGGYLSAAPDRITNVDSLAARPELPAAAIQEFRKFAVGQGVEIPAGAEVDARLQRVLAADAALVKFGEPGFYRVAAVLDPTVHDAAAQFAHAAAILAGSH
jgi:carboxyl-terminal processing protease